MDAILNLLKDPAWWFTAVPVAIASGIAAAYLKDWISKGLARVSSTFRVWWEKKQEERKKKALKVAHHPTLLILMFLIFLLQYIAMVTLAILVLIVPTIMGPLIVAFGSEVPASQVKKEIFYWEITLIILTSVLGYFVGTGMMAFKRAYDAYYDLVKEEE